MKWLFSRFLDLLPDYYWVIRIVELVPESWCDQAD